MNLRSPEESHLYFTSILSSTDPGPLYVEEVENDLNAARFSCTVFDDIKRLERHLRKSNKLNMLIVCTNFSTLVISLETISCTTLRPAAGEDGQTLPCGGATSALPLRPGGASCDMEKDRLHPLRQVKDVDQRSEDFRENCRKPTKVNNLSQFWSVNGLHSFSRIYRVFFGKSNTFS